MRITWLVSSAVTIENGQWHSPLASIRYRVLAPARYLRDEGHQVGFLRLDESRGTDELAAALRADVVVVSKVLARGSVEMARQAQRLGARVIVDLCDDHFDSPELGRAYSELCGLADHIVASTAAMAAAIARHTARRANIIDDPFEGPAGEPRFEPAADRVRLVWFGHPVNFDTVLAMMPQLADLGRSLPLSLHVVSDPTHNDIRQYLNSINAHYAPRLQTRFTVWSPQTTWQAIGDCDLVVVPSLPSAKKLVKSPNRVVEPLRGGRFVVAYPLPSYAELGEFAWLGQNMAQGIAWAVSHPAEVVRRIQSGQQYVGRRFSPLAIARVWEAVLLQAAECDRNAA